MVGGLSAVRSRASVLQQHEDAKKAVRDRRSPAESFVQDASEEASLCEISMELRLQRE
jgi:hypothetical protein